jgi:hypothetical protein
MWNYVIFMSFFFLVQKGNGTSLFHPHPPLPPPQKKLKLFVPQKSQKLSVNDGVCVCVCFVCQLTELDDGGSLSGGVAEYLPTVCKRESTAVNSRVSDP